MKCAVEFEALKKVATIAWLEEEAKKDEKAKEDFQIACGRAVAFCENDVDTALTEKALNRHNLQCSWKIDMSEDRLGNQLFQLVERDGRKYANGNYSYHACGLYYSWKALVDYLRVHCLDVQLIDDTYQQYGFGTKRCFTMRIFVAE